MKLNPYLIPHTKINSKNIEDLNIRPETKSPGRNHRAKYFDIGLGNSFFDMSPNVRSTEGNTRIVPVFLRLICTSFMPTDDHKF